MAWSELWKNGGIRSNSCSLRRPQMPKHLWTAQAVYSPNVFASPFNPSSTTSILIKLVFPETL
jgi:hypothetical protein